MNKNITLMSFTALALVANAFNPAISHAATAPKLKAAAFTFALWSDMPYAKFLDTTSSTVAVPASDGSIGSTP